MKKSPHTKAEVTNALTGEIYQLRPLSDIEVTSKRIDQLVTVCNEPEIYRWLFQEKRQGAPYPRSLAEQWFSWGAEGWENGSHFIFALLDSEGKVIASLGIKNAYLELGEIGYWCSAEHRGVMTRAVETLLDLARAVDFKRFYAQVHRENTKSARLLERAGFQLSDEIPELKDHLVYQRA